MFLATEQERKNFLEMFFAPDANGDLLREPWEEPWLDYFVTSGLPAIIPFWRHSKLPESNKKFYLSIFSQDVAMLRQIESEGRAFLGKVHAFTRVKNPSDLFVRQGLGDMPHAAVYLPSSDHQQAQQNAIRDWLTVWQQKNVDYKPNLREESTGQLRELRRVFEQCLATRDRTGAQGAIRAIGDAALLDNTNRLFLQIRLFAFFEDWEAISENANFTDLMNVRRTDPVTESLLQSVYHTRLAEFENDLPKLLEQFEAVYTDFRPLFRSRGGLCSPEVLRLFLLRAIASLDSNPEDLQAIIADEAILPTEKEFAERLLSYAPLSSPVASVALVSPVKSSARVASATREGFLAAAKTAIYNGLDDRALALFAEVPAGVDKVAALLAYNRDTNSLVAQRVTLQSLQELPATDYSAVMGTVSLQSAINRLLNGNPVVIPRAKLSPTPEPSHPPRQAITKALPSSPPIVAPIPIIVIPTLIPVQTAPQQEVCTSVRPYTETQTLLSLHDLPAVVPSDWLQWLDAVSAGKFGAESLYEMAVSGVSQWDIVRSTNTPVAARTFAESMDILRGAGTLEETEVFFDGLPLLIRAVTTNDAAFPRSIATPVYNSLRQSVAFYLQNIRFDRNTLTLFYDLLVASLATVPGAHYKDMLGEIKGIWDKDAPVYARSLLDLLDALQDYPTHDSAARRTLATQAFAIVSGWQSSNRIDASDVSYAHRLASEYNLGAMIQAYPSGTANEPTDTPQEPDWGLLSGKQIGIYTLMETAGNRLRGLIREKCAGCLVQTNAEKAGSESLKNFAQTSDILIIVTGCAKHAATEFLERWQPAGRSLLRPDGRGSSSVLAALENYLRETVM